MGHARTRCILTVMAVLFSPFVLLAGGSLDNTSAPELGSAMPTTTEIYNQLTTGCAAITPSATFREPSAVSTVGSGKRTLAEIQAELPQPDIHGVLPEEVPLGKTFWGLNKAGGAWGLQTGGPRAQTGGPQGPSADLGSLVRCRKVACIDGYLVIGTYGCP